MKSNAQDFKITLGKLITTFLWMEVEQSNGKTLLHLDTYVQEMAIEYKKEVQLVLKLKKTLMQPGLVLDASDALDAPDLVTQKNYLSFVVTVSV
jgi:hypothetical protein